MDDKNIQSIRDVSSLMYPSDNSVIKVDQFEVGGQTFTKSVIYKDNFTFGLREATVEADPSMEEQKEFRNEEGREFGLFSYKKIGDTELWMTFENNTKMLAEVIGMKKVETRL
mmetsp:Transcript_30515/g.29918  ORF Transcript_30515/g.29918 Transcript_30515/m.29918 type:complete len:113 (-) Transcript_30515:2646-2984(-)